MLCFITIVLTSQAQDKNFDLSKYKFPDYKSHEMEFSFGSYGSGSNFSGFYTPSNNEPGRIIDYRNVYSYTNLNLGYSFTKSNRKRQENINSYFSSTYRFDKSVNENGKRTFSSPGSDFKIYANERYYLTENKWFLEAYPYFESEIWSTNEMNPDLTKMERKGVSFSTRLGLGGGIGRIENVSEYWQAYYILEELKKQGSLIRNYEDKDIHEFASLASRLKSMRFFDSRLKKIDEMKSIDSLMHENQLIQNSDISYFATLSDYWNFASISNRFSGKVLKFLVTPSYGYRFTEEIGKSKNTIKNTDIKSELSFNCNKQLNLFWDRFFSLNITNITPLNIEEFVIKHPKNYQEISSYFGLGYYPNFRTKFTTQLSYNGSQFLSGLKDDGTKYKKVWSNSIALYSSAYYYISPQLRIEGNISTRYTDKIKTNNLRDRLDFTYNIAFRYAIF
ncbi:MAG TPA: hypothetical protein DCR40_14815 [Prolixibacteraceae bacterium]|nr:hypothetical protein [Prolixibacteraceae bacterium]